MSICLSSHLFLLVFYHLRIHIQELKTEPITTCSILQGIASTGPLLSEKLKVLRVLKALRSPEAGETMAQMSTPKPWGFSSSDLHGFGISRPLQVEVLPATLNLGHLLVRALASWQNRSHLGWKMLEVSKSCVIRDSKDSSESELKLTQAWLSSLSLRSSLSALRTSLDSTAMQ